MATMDITSIDLVSEMSLFNQGLNFRSYEFLGCKPCDEGFCFTVWAPHAKSVSLVGDFSEWNPLPMDALFETGAWTLRCDNAKIGDCYKYRIEDQFGHTIDKIDPYALQHEVPPKDASIVSVLPKFAWKDATWLRSRRHKVQLNQAINVYEVHATSWKKAEDGRDLNLQELADVLIPYVKDMGYTHIEFMPVMDHPLDASWGYQITGYFAVAGRYGTVEQFMYLVNEAHKAGIGVLLDWVPGHFNRNEVALSYYDGTPTYEYQSHIRATNVRWGTLNFDLGKNQVHSFLISNAMFWLKELHIDGIRVDAVSNMLYLDYDEGPHELNEDGGNINREGVQFIQKMNTEIFKAFPDVLMIAEESTNYQGITSPVHHGGLGFNLKWNMGWMNDTLRYFETDPIYRPYHFDLLNFLFVYMHNENYMYALSHDEVVHGKHSLLGKMPGDRYKQFAQLRLLQGLMLGLPGKKLNFMGYEIGQFLEWRFKDELEWNVLSYPHNSEYKHYIKTLNSIYTSHNALYLNDFETEAIKILEADDPIMIFTRYGKIHRDLIICIYNFSFEEKKDYRIGVPYRGTYEVLLNSEMQEFGGCWQQNLEVMETQVSENHNETYAIDVLIPSMSVLFIKPKRIYKE
ncbi:1,4-alpha-glucan branching protein GlgB [Erysipelothrix sp. HDW6A]|uniref:1,4-alpha-glucan branching protein GlgB n=1 Tax=Erysipelothrix sp. HDW6A TaxID=2714928 RepID=UPI00196A8F77|nr:1,4-alpha-glucan branching protein GlgB [Erysipelothrix sp. HDW6A]